MNLRTLRKAIVAAGLTTSAASLFGVEPAFAKCGSTCNSCTTCTTCVPAGDVELPICRMSVICGQSVIAGELKPSTGGVLS